MSPTPKLKKTDANTARQVSSDAAGKTAAQAGDKTAGLAAGQAAVKPATLRDVARHAGVSSCTASKILNRSHDVARFTQATQERVRQAAAALQYTPSQVGRSLAGSRSMTIGLIVKGISSHITDQNMRYVIETAHTRDYLTCVKSIRHWGDDSQLVLEAAREMQSRGVDGLVIYRNLPIDPKVRRELEAMAFPVVYLGWGPARSQRRVIFDRHKSMDELAVHLSSLGHKEVAYLSTVGQMDFPELKYLPLRRAFAHHGMELVMDSRWLIHEEKGDFDLAVPSAVRAFLETGSTATAMLANNDNAALIAMSTLQQAGVRVPEQMSVVGFDNLFFAQYCHPPLTSVAMPSTQAVGQAAFDMLYQLMLDPTAPVQKQHHECSLVIRQSTAMAATGAITATGAMAAQDDGDDSLNTRTESLPSASQSVQRNSR